MLTDTIDPAELIAMTRRAIATMPMGAWRDDLQTSLDSYIAGSNRMRLFYLLMLKQYPVDIETFLFDPMYMDAKGHIWPELLPDIKEVNNPDGDRLGMKYHEAVLTGGIGTAKTTQALYGLAYQLYLLSCYREPHLVLGQDPSAEILFIFQSVNSKVAKSDYLRFRHMIMRSPYFRDNFDFRRDIETTMIFPHRIEVQPVTGEVNATIGQNVFGGLLDEVNFMIKTTKSKKSSSGGEFDQAAELYSSIDSRRKSRFMELGCVPGLLFISSSKNYPGQFTDVKEKEAKTNPGIYYWDKRVWDVRPKKFTGEKFWIFVGDTSSQPFIITEQRRAPADAKAKGLLDQIPVEYLSRFEDDIYNSLREIAGRSTLSTCPYIPNAQNIAASFKKTRPSVVGPTIVDFETIRATAFPFNITHRDEPRAVHLDLALNGDLAGISCGFIEKFVEVNDEGERYMMPVINYDFTMGVKAPPRDDINFSRIRKMITDLRTKCGLPIKWVTMDSFQSKDTQQILKQLGFLVGELSMDITAVPYDCFKTAINQGRIVAPENEVAQLEIIRLERGPDGKIDHPADGSKDIADSMAGVCYFLTNRKENWFRHGVQPRMPMRDVARRLSEQ